MTEKLRSVMPLDRGPRREDTATRNVCGNCLVRWWTSGGDAERCPRCGVSFADRDAWKAQPFQPERLTIAREACGVDIDELVRMVGMPIAEFEHGSAVPSTGQMIQIARALKSILPGFLTKPVDDMPELGPIFWCNTSTYCYREDCPNLAVALCDYPKAGGGTCDREICGDHGKRVGEEIDYCFDCLRREQMRKDSPQQELVL